MKSNWESRYSDWEGTAAELATTVSEILARLRLPDDAPTPNERLVRHYAQQGILERPVRHGKEAYFGFRQIVEFLVARSLIGDGWPLAKIAEFNRATDLPQLLDILPRGPAGNRAQQLVSRFQEDAAARPRPAKAEQQVSPRSFLARSAELTKGRISGRETLAALGNPSASPERDDLVRLALAPWCHVYFDPEVLRRLPPDTAGLLGQALTHCLMDERIRTGEKK